MKKWLHVAQTVLPFIAVFYPAAAPFVPFINAGVAEAAEFVREDGETDEQYDARRRQHVHGVVNVGVGALNASGKVKIDPAVAQSTTSAVFQTIDAVHATIKANQPPAAPASK